MQGICSGSLGVGRKSLWKTNTLAEFMTHSELSVCQAFLLAMNTRWKRIACLLFQVNILTCKKYIPTRNPSPFEKEEWYYISLKSWHYWIHPVLPSTLSASGANSATFTWKSRQRYATVTAWSSREPCPGFQACSSRTSCSSQHYLHTR